MNASKDTESKVFLSKEFQEYLKKGAQKRQELMEEAYDWAVSEQKRWNKVSNFSNLVFHSDWLTSDGDCYEKNGYIVEEENECIFSLFMSEREKRVILRLDWPRQMSFKYYDIMNYDEVCQTAPRSVRSMKANALRLSKAFEDNGDVYRYMDWD